MKSIQQHTKIAGLLYLLIAICGGFSIGYVPAILVISGNEIETANNVINNQGLFRLGILADIAVFLFEIVLTVILYQIFKPINETFAMIAAYARMAMSVVMGLNLITFILPLLMITDVGLLTGFEPNQLKSFALFSFEIHQLGIYIWGMFFGLHLIFLGYLVVKSGFFPKTLGYLMGIGSIGYLGESIVATTLSQHDILTIIVNSFLAIAVIGELSFTSWLLIKGINVTEWNRKNDATFLTD